MRPVLLQMHGFASFREPTTIDFTDADYFALVGPTGSGKSTIVDAMTFALYGSAPRWAHRTSVKWALAPTTTRATVRLVFEAGAHRYVVAREVRRTSQGVQSKGMRLERLTDPTGLGTVDELTQPIASDSGVTDAVERLLGLTFEQFCQCVVLPQGEFARFLQAAQADRQKILLKLLGAERYDEIARRAHQEAAAAESRAGVLADQVANLADATEDAERRARSRQEDLERLMTHLEEQVPLLDAATQDFTDAQSEHEVSRAQQATLSGLAIPDDVPDLDARHRAAMTAVQHAADGEAAAAEHDTLARKALQTGPDRGPLEAARAHHAERADMSAQVPAAIQARSNTASAVTAVGIQIADAADALELARADLLSARQAAERAHAQVQRLSDERDLLAGLVVPDGVADLAERISAAHSASAAARAALTRAEEQDGAAQAARSRAPDRTALERARDTLTDLADRQARLPDLDAAADLAAAGCRDADAAVALAAADVASAEDRHRSAQQADLAATLRLHLQPGGPCPVCEQTVAVVPARLDTAQLGAAGVRLEAARARLTTAQQGLRAAQGRHLAASAARDAVTADRDRLQAALTAGLADLPTVGAALATLADLDATVDAARAALQAARRQATRTGDAVSLLAAEETAARRALRTARDPLVRLGAPAVDDTDLITAWTTLSCWARDQQAARVQQVATAHADCVGADLARDRAQGVFDHREADLAHARQTQHRAVQEAEQARAQADLLTRRLTELADLLTDAPTDAAAQALLAHVARLEAAARRADADLVAARAAHDGARRRLADLDAQVAAGFAGLRRARDAFVVLGAPDVPGDTLLDGWTQLAGWAAHRAAALLDALPRLAARVESARRSREQISSRLAARLVEYGIDVPAGELATRSSSAVAVALEGARRDSRDIRQRRASAARLTDERAEAEREQQVAKLLGDLLRADGFQRWLATTALDTLVVDASQSLRDLSGGQFDLAHEKGDFYVIDHADADSRRSVKTLSGGETFQASLALALALSAHMSALAAAGVARLDSIFLDEGFGTLDPDTLDVVATTLETLAQGERMVGVITHVAALAERVPVRFRVHRDAITSRVVREST